jgi:hypothetical protein
MNNISLENVKTYKIKPPCPQRKWRDLQEKFPQMNDIELNSHNVPSLRIVYLLKEIVVLD